MLLINSASPNIMGAGGNTALHVATQHLDFVCTQLLVARGADLNARNAAGAGSTKCVVAQSLIVIFSIYDAMIIIYVCSIVG